MLHASDVVLTASGTATVQTALHEKPMVILYKLSPLTYRLGRPFVKVDTFGMANLIAGRRIVPELIQDDCTPERVAGEALALLTDRARADADASRPARGASQAGRTGASARAAAAVSRSPLKRESYGHPRPFAPSHRHADALVKRR